MGNTHTHSENRYLGSAGFTLIEVLAALAILAIATLGIMSLTTLYSATATRSNVVSAMTDIELDAYFMQDNLPEWIANTMDPTKTTFYIAAIANCFKSTGAVCPAALTTAQLDSILDPELQSFVTAGKTIASVALRNLQGTIIAGTHTTPVYYTSSGSMTTEPSLAAFSVAGYMARDNATGSPGKVLLLMRLNPMSAEAGSGAIKQTMRQRWTRVNVGTRWEVISNDIFGACTAGEYIYAVDKATGTIQCRSLETRCVGNAFAVGIKSDGHMDCVAMPPTVIPSPYVPPTQFNCDSWGHSTASCTIPGNPVIKDVSVSSRQSRAGCSIGSDVTWAGATITVRDGCRATFNVFY